ncbi:MAG: guanylate kinase [Nitrospirota bacterium]
MREKNPLQARKSRGNLFIVSAPSGAGKTTLCKKLVSALPDLKFSVSYTTRRPREGEVNNSDYTFVGREDFRAMINRGEFIEWSEIHGELYGTSRKRLQELVDLGNDVILDIDTQGATQLKEKSLEGTFIFILPPSLEILRKRLESRLTESREDIEKRLKRAIAEIRTYAEYDYVIINNILEQAIKELESVILSQRVNARTINHLWIEKFFLRQEVI